MRRDLTTRSIINGPHRRNGPVLFCWLSSSPVVDCNAAGRPPGAWVQGTTYSMLVQMDKIPQGKVRGIFELLTRQ